MIDRERLIDIAAAFGLPMGGSVLGSAFAGVADIGHVYGAAIGAIAGLLSVGLRGWFRLKELQQQHATEELKLGVKRLRKKIAQAGLDPDTD